MRMPFGRVTGNTSNIGKTNFYNVQISIQLSLQKSFDFDISVTPWQFSEKEILHAYYMRVSFHDSVIMTPSVGYLTSTL